MKRTPLQRKTPLTSRSPLKSTTPMRRGGRVNPVSDKRAEDVERRRDVRLELFRRDRGRCLLEKAGGPCAGPWTPHHVKKASAGGPYVLANLETLCAHHNGMVEDRPDWGWRLGLVCRAGETLAMCAQRRSAAGLAR